MVCITNLIWSTAFLWNLGNFGQFLAISETSDSLRDTIRDTKRVDLWAKLSWLLLWGMIYGKIHPFFMGKTHYFYWAMASIAMWMSLPEATIIWCQSHPSPVYPVPGGLRFPKSSISRSSRLVSSERHCRCSSWPRGCFKGGAPFRWLSLAW